MTAPTPARSLVRHPSGDPERVFGVVRGGAVGTGQARTTTRSWCSSAAPARPISRPPIASFAMNNSIRIAIWAIAMRSIWFKEHSMRPMMVLKDGDKRAAYDCFGHAAFEQGDNGGGPGFGAEFASSFADIFDDFFGMGGGRRGRGSGRERGADLRYNMELTLEEAFGGKSAQIRIPTSVTCETCSGSGAKAGTSKPKVQCQPAAVRGQDPPCPGLLHTGTHLPDPPRPRPSHRHAMRNPRRPRPGTTRERAPSRSTFRPASRTAPASAWPARARPGCAAARPAISISSCRSRRTPSSSATVPTCIAARRSR